MTTFNRPQQIGRRAFLQSSTLVLGSGMLGASALCGDSLAAAEDAQSRLRIGMITDLHYADKPAAGSRFYRETIGKLSEAATRFETEQPAFLVELGDLIDAADSVETELRYLRTINQPFAAICKERHYVLGNHCVDTLNKDEFLGEVGQERSYYSFDRDGFHFVILDACFRSDETPYGRKNSTWTDTFLPAHELEWLAADLAATEKQTIVFAHQRLDVSTQHGVKNNQQARELLESSGNVLAVFQGHSHKNDLNDINGIHYCTLVAMVEGSGEDNSGYTLLDIAPDGTLFVKGFRKQSAYQWGAAHQAKPA